MQNNVYKLIELTGTSDQSIEDAVQNAVARAAKTVKNMRWFQTVEIRGALDNGQVRQWQVTIKVGFSVEE